MLVTQQCVIPIEFKVGLKKFKRLDMEQAWDFRIDPKNFHAPSHAAPIFPILCATEVRDSDRRWKPPHADGVRPPFRCSGDSLGRAIRLALEDAGKKVPATIFTSDASTSPDAAKMVAGTFLDPATWGTGSYSPTPTIIEAARSLYARHTVHDITRSDAGAVNLAATSGCIKRIIAAAKAGRRKAIVFVTGVPGAGKTLVGLNVATRHGERSDAAHAVFLFGKARWWRCCGRPWPATTSTARGAPTRRPASAPPEAPSKPSFKTSTISATTRSATPLRPTTMSWCSTRPSGRGMPGSSHPS